MAPTRAGPMEYRLTGRGPVVLVLKGGHSSRDTRLGHERLTAYGFAVLEPSRPGYDGSPASLGRSASDAANALAALLDTLAIERADVVAISAAGHTAIELARRHPQRVRRVSFESARSLPWNATTRRMGRLVFGRMQAPVWVTVRAALRLAPAETLRVLLSELTTLDPGQVVHEMDAATRAEYVAAFRSLWSREGFICDLDHTSEGSMQLTQPVLILHGRHDRAIPPHHVERLVALCPTNRRIELDADTHFIWFGRTRVEVWEKRLAFLRS